MGNHKEWRKLAKKDRRKAIRQRNAKQLQLKEDAAQLLREKSPTYQNWLLEQEQLEQHQQQQEEQLQLERHEKWLKDEEIAQQQWRELQLKLEQGREEKAKQIARIKEEWEREQRKLKELKKQKEKEEEEKRRKDEELRMQINDFIENGGDVPKELEVNLETNPLKQICLFFNKTGTCRFKDLCTRNHVRPGVSRTLLIQNFYNHYSLQKIESEHGNDGNLEFETSETYAHFKEFFYDVLLEMEKCGTIKQFKVCCNQEVHLRGNVYVEYRTLRQALIGYQKFQGRWYGGRQLHVEFCNIQSWKAAICGLFARERCPKGSACNFLHVFINPGHMFMNADKDLHRTPEPSERSYDTESSRNWRWSESPEPFCYTESSEHKKYKKLKRDKGREPHRHEKRRHDDDYKRKSRSSEKYKKRKHSSSDSRERSPTKRYNR